MCCSLLGRDKDDITVRRLAGCRFLGTIAPSLSSRNPSEDTLKGTRGQDGEVKLLVTAVRTTMTSFQPIDGRPCFRFWALSRGSRALKTPAKAGNITQLVKCQPCMPKDPSSIPEGDPSARETHR